jgi:hypothetical protein
LPSSKRKLGQKNARELSGTARGSDGLHNIAKAAAVLVRQLHGNEGVELASVGLHPDAAVIGVRFVEEPPAHPLAAPVDRNSKFRRHPLPQLVKIGAEFGAIGVDLRIRLALPDERHVYTGEFRMQPAKEEAAP